MYCSHCGKQNAIMFASTCGPLFNKENRPSIPRGDAMHAAIEFVGRGPDLVPFFCNSCHKWFAIFCLPSESNDRDNRK